MPRLAWLASLVLVSACENPTGSIPLPMGDLAGTCTLDVQCRAPRPRCDLNTGNCVACLPASDNCPKGQKCVPAGGTFICSASCVTDVDCPRADGGSTMSCCGGHCFDTAGDIQNCGTCSATCLAPPNAT